MRTMAPDYEAYDRLRVFFNYSQDVQDVQPPTNLIVEVRTCDTNQLPQSKYWTVFGLYDPAG